MQKIKFRLSQWLLKTNFLGLSNEIVELQLCVNPFYVVKVTHFGGPSTLCKHTLQTPCCFLFL